jgi:manganese/zinc/iron transport system permease protein
VTISPDAIFLVQSGAGAAVVGALCGIAGVWMVLRRFALLGDAAAHSSLAGICAAFLVTGSQNPFALMTGALLSAGAATALMQKLSTGRTRPDAVLALVLSVFFGLGSILLAHASASPTGTQAGLHTFLLGNAAAISGTDLVALALAATAILCAMFAWHRALLFSTFDPQTAGLAGFRPGLINGAVLVALSLVVVLCVRTVGVVMVAAMLVIPAQTALIATRRLEVALVVAGLIGAVCGISGTLFSISYSGVSTGPSMVLTAGLIFAVTAASTTIRGRLRVGREVEV